MSAEQPPAWWMQSQTIRGLVAALIGIIGGILGRSFEDTQITAIAEGVSVLLSIGGTLYAMKGRQKTQVALVEARTETVVLDRKVEIAKAALERADVPVPRALTVPTPAPPAPEEKVP